ncbi:MAG: methionine synthase [Proteobacteria bacterium]|nr:methionine synthase [Pseudomonadota bacterium]
MSALLDFLAGNVLLCDGAMGTRVQATDLDIEEDFLGKENCTEILNQSRPDLVRDIHMGYLGAGSDAVTTNSFGGSPITLGEFGLEDDAFAINKRASEIAQEAVAEFAHDGRQRFVLGDIGPGTKLPSLGHIDYQSLEDAYAAQGTGLIAGGVDALLVETCQDPLQIKAAVNGAKRARDEAKSDIPIIVQVTVETTGTLLVGADIAAAATVVRALDVPVMGLNCATGPQEMAEHVKWLGENWPDLITIQPNAGLPELVDGKPSYPLGPDELAKWMERFIKEDGVNMVGGCCGTDVEHIEALDHMLRRLGGNAPRPRPSRRSVHWLPSAASLYAQVPFRQENAYFSIGERCNANGSRAFRRLQEEGDWDGCVAIGREQVDEGSHALDVCTAFVGRDEVSDMTEVVSRMRGSVTAPLVFDSTEYEVLRSALALYGGKGIINSINFEDGEEPPAKRLELARRFGAGVIALTIDEEGMAKETDAKIEIAKRLHDFACGRYGLASSDLMIDPLTFTICTGNEDDRKLGLNTLDAIERLAKELPECQIILGLSNISFGLNPASRHVLNSVFLDHALKRGLTGAIVHFTRIMPLHKIPEEEARVAEDLIYDRRKDGYDPLHAFLALFEDRTVEKKAVKARPEKVEERLSQRIVDGDRQGLEADLDEALAKHDPLEIVNSYLLDGMKVVGELFGAGKMQLPFVLQSAETMKAAVGYLEPFMDKIEGQEKGTIILATVRGDVHDIGKNLVDIILTNNGYKVINLGIKQPIGAIIEAAREHGADAIGMSGLLVKSTVVMRQNLEEMTREDIDVPVLLGGAALTRGYVEEDCVNAYGRGRVAYARDAFDGLGLMNKVMAEDFDDHIAGLAEKRRGRPSRKRRRGAEAPAPAPGEPGETAGTATARAADFEEIRLKRAELAAGAPPPSPPFWGARTIEEVPLKSLTPYLNERMLYQFHWGYRKEGRRLDEYMKWARKELRPILNRLVKQSAEEGILAPKAVYGYWKCASDNDDIVLFADDGKAEVARFSLPRQAKAGGLCIADFVRPIDADSRDVIGLQVVTVGQRASEVARQWFAEDRYQDYLYLHGLGVEMAEAMAEYVHKRIRAELGFAGEDARDIDELLRQGYRGSRYSFGYPACPNLADQRQILGLLDASRIGIVMSEEDQLHPEQSTSAIVITHPQAKYFSV